MDPEHSSVITDFDLLLSISLRLVREVTTKTSLASVPVEILDSASSLEGGHSRVREATETAPV